MAYVMKIIYYFLKLLNYNIFFFFIVVMDLLLIILIEMIQEDTELIIKEVIINIFNLFIKKIILLNKFLII